MTIKELADIAGVSRDTIRRVVKKLYPDEIVNGKKTMLNDIQCQVVMMEARKKNMVSPTQSAQVPTQSAQVDYEVIGKMIGMAVSAAMQPVVKQLQSISNPVLQIEQPKQDYFSLVAYCSLNKIKTVDSELRKMGMDLRKMAKESGKELHKIPDERYGQVNSYPLEILEEYFSE
jgi:hypothetical protein